MPQATRPALTWRELRNPNKVWSAERFQVELRATDNDGRQISVVEIFDAPHPLHALGIAFVNFQRLHPAARIDIDETRIYPR